jgi:uncharacterized protein (UPF0548 family)
MKLETPLRYFERVAVGERGKLRGRQSLIPERDAGNIVLAGQITAFAAPTQRLNANTQILLKVVGSMTCQRYIACRCCEL